jgi:AcrR family transcriptional regulator
MPTFEADPNAGANNATVASSRERILLSAKHLFARNGYENTSTVAIAREAGTSESQLMKHFGSKQGLLSAILDRGWASIIERVQALPMDTSLADRLCGMLQAIAAEMENDQELKELATLEARRVRKDSRDVIMSRGYRQFSQLFEGVLSEMRNRQQIRSDLNLEAVRTAFIGMVESLLRDQVVSKRSELRASYGFDDVRHLLAVLLSAVTTDHVPSLKYANG